MYVEPFGGEFGLYEIMSNEPTFSVYNDINFELYEKIKNKYKYNSSIFCFNKDYKEIIYNYNTENTFYKIRQRKHRSL